MMILTFCRTPARYWQHLPPHCMLPRYELATGSSIQAHWEVLPKVVTDHPIGVWEVRHVASHVIVICSHCLHLRSSTNNAQACKDGSDRALHLGIWDPWTRPYK